MKILNHPVKRETIQLSALVLLFLLVYLSPISLIFQNSFSQHFSHQLLILAISGYMIWMKRERLRRAQPRPALITGSLVMLVGSIMLTAGDFSGTLLLEGLSLVIAIFGMVWLLLGSSIIKIIAIPLSFLIFMFPIFDKLLRGHTEHLQLTAASIGAMLLKMAGMPIFHLGELIQLPHITMVVGEACSGVNHMIALMTLGAFLGYVTETRWFTKLIFVLMGLVVGILANGIRVALIGIWTRFFGGESFHGPFDIFYSSFVFLFGLVVVIVVKFVLLKHRKEKPATNENQLETSFKVPSDRKYFRLSFITATIILVLTWTYQTLARPLPFDLRKSLDELSLDVRHWEGRIVDRLSEPYESGNFDVSTKRIYDDRSGNQIKLFIGYLMSQAGGENVDHYPHAINQTDSSTVEIKSNPSGVFRISNAIYQGRDRAKEVFFWYDINGRVIADRSRAKLATIEDAFLKRRTNAAVIVVSTDIKGRGREKEGETAVLKFIERILPLIQRSLNE